MLAREMEGRAAGDEALQLRAGGQRFGDLGRGCGDLLEVVEEQQYFSLSKFNFSCSMTAPAARLAQAKRFADGDNDPCRDR